MALYSYTGEVGDLSFSEGDVIKVHKDEGEWWEGSCRGEQGLFPANYVKKKDTEVTVWHWYMYPYSLTSIQYMYVIRETPLVCASLSAHWQVCFIFRFPKLLLARNQVKKSGERLHFWFMSWLVYLLSFWLSKDIRIAVIHATLYPRDGPFFYLSVWDISAMLKFVAFKTVSSLLKALAKMWNTGFENWGISLDTPPAIAVWYCVA